MKLGMFWGFLVREGKKGRGFYEFKFKDSREGSRWFHDIQKMGQDFGLKNLILKVSKLVAINP